MTHLMLRIGVLYFLTKNPLLERDHCRTRKNDISVVSTKNIIIRLTEISLYTSAIRFSSPVVHETTPPSGIHNDKYWVITSHYCNFMFDYHLNKSTRPRPLFLITLSSILPWHTHFISFYLNIKARIDFWSFGEF